MTRSQVILSLLFVALLSIIAALLTDNMDKRDAIYDLTHTTITCDGVAITVELNTRETIALVQPRCRDYSIHAG